MKHMIILTAFSTIFLMCQKHPIVMTTPIHPNLLCGVIIEEPDYETYEDSDTDKRKFQVIAANREERKDYIRKLQKYNEDLRTTFCEDPYEETEKDSL